MVRRAVCLQRQGLDVLREPGRAPQAQQHDVLVVRGRVVAGVWHGPGHRTLFLEALSLMNVVLPQVDLEIPGEGETSGETPDGAVAGGGSSVNHPPCFPPSSWNNPGDCP